MDLTKWVFASDLQFYTESSASAVLGCGGTFGGTNYFYQQWEHQYINKFKPSIEYLELYAVCAGAYIWSEKLSNQRVIMHYDNLAVVSMINKTTSSCKHFMHLIRLLVIRALKFNFRLFSVHVGTKQNGLADSLSRLQLDRFRRICGKQMSDTPEKMPVELWPASKIWNGFAKHEYLFDFE